MDSLDRTISRLRRRWLAGELLQAAAAWAAGLLLTVGAILLVAKLFAPRVQLVLPWLTVALVPLAVVVIWRAVRRMPAEWELVAHLDQRLDAGGLLMSLVEHPDSSWRNHLPDSASWRNAIPAIRPVRFLRIIAMPLLFAVGAGFVPAREEPPPSPRLTAGTNAARELAETFELLDRSDMIDQETRAAFQRELNELAAESHEAPFTHEKWETVDALRDRLRSSMDATQHAIVQGQSAAAILADAQAEGQPLTAERTEQLTAELREAMDALRKNGAFDATTGEGAATISEDVQKLVRSVDFELPDDATARSQALDQLREFLDGEAQKIAEARSRSAATLGSQGVTGRGEAPLTEAGSATRSGQAGDSRGSGDVALDFGAESNEQAARFKEVVLPPGYLDRPSESVAGVAASAPTVAPATVGERNAARNGGTATGSVTWGRILRPRHRDVVRGYFQDGEL